MKVFLPNLQRIRAMNPGTLAETQRLVESVGYVVNVTDRIGNLWFTSGVHACAKKWAVQFSRELGLFDPILIRRGLMELPGNLRRVKVLTAEGRILDAMLGSNATCLPMSGNFKWLVVYSSFMKCSDLRRDGTSQIRHAVAHELMHVKYYASIPAREGHELYERVIEMKTTKFLDEVGNG